MPAAPWPQVLELGDAGGAGGLGIDARGGPVGGGGGIDFACFEGDLGVGNDRLGQGQGELDALGGNGLGADLGFVLAQDQLAVFDSNAGLAGLGEGLEAGAQARLGEQTAHALGGGALDDPGGVEGGIANGEVDGLAALDGALLGFVLEAQVEQEGARRTVQLDEGVLGRPPRGADEPHVQRTAAHAAPDRGRRLLEALHPEARAESLEFALAGAAAAHRVEEPDAEGEQEQDTEDVGAAQGARRTVAQARGACTADRDD